MQHALVSGQSEATNYEFYYKRIKFTIKFVAEISQKIVNFSQIEREIKFELLELTHCQKEWTVKIT